MNAKARALGLRETHFVRPDGLDVAGHVSSARDVTLLARAAMQNATIRSIVDDRTATISGGRRLHTWNDLLGSFPGVIGVKTGHTDAAGWSQVAAARGAGSSSTRPCSEPDASAAEHRPRRAAAVGPLPVRAGRRRRRDPHVRARRRRLRPEAGRARRAALDRPLHPRRPPAPRADRRRHGGRAPGPSGAAPGRGARLRRSEARGELAARRRARGRAEPGLAARASWYARRTVSNLWP